MVTCQLCKQRFHVISVTHLASKHKMSFREYKRRFPDVLSCFPVVSSLLPKSDYRYQRWRSSLKQRPVWIKGKTKETDYRVRKISETMKRKGLDNFAKWRLKMIKLGRIRNTYPSFKKSKELAFLYGLSLGDGNISKFPRTECLTISLNTKYPELVSYTHYLLSKFFEKQPTRDQIGNCARLRIYQKKISERLGIPLGNRHKAVIEIPKWIWGSQECLVWYLKGLFEAEGSLSIHLPTSTYNFQFSNTNEKLLENVGKVLEALGFHPEYREKATRLRRRKEVEFFKRLIFFRDYNIAG